MKYYGLIMPSVFPTGVFIQDIRQTVSSNESEGINTMTVTLTNQQKAHFNIKNGKQGSSAQATAQMEQHAKEYISSEFTRQKTALEQAIKDGKTDITNSITQANNSLKKAFNSEKLKIEKILQNKIDEIDEIMETTNQNFIKLLKNGYIQWPGMPRPDIIFDFPGYRWEEVNYKGSFFRAKGSGALPFNEVEQGDAIRNITGKIPSGRVLMRGNQVAEGYKHLALMKEHTKGCFYVDGSNFDDSYAQRDIKEGIGMFIQFNASNAVPTAEENRPRNRTIIIWRLREIIDAEEGEE